MILQTLQLAILLFAFSACTIPHSKQALWTSETTPPSDKSRFVTEEDSGLSLLGIFQLSEPDHYAVLLERARRFHKCERLHHTQLDYYTDHWLIVAFPISRITVVCDPRRAEAPALEGKAKE